MLFNTAPFPIFLFVVLFVFHLSPRRYKNLLLVIASYVFYSFWNWKFCSLLAISTIVDYYCGLQLDASGRSDSARRRFLLVSLVTNLGILGFFKYFNFFVDSFSELLLAFGMRPDFATLNIVLPVGISFYTFQTLSYTIDVYRRKIPHERDFITFALYVAFFPQLVAGPIERARNLLPQFKLPRKLNSTLMWEGALLVVSGYLKKIVISDQISPMVDQTFINWEVLPSIQLWEGLLLFSLQIYFDFSGYTDIARGVAKWFGIELMQNFKQPYLSTSITEFWRRWHISLSTWLKEYLYIPLGGNRKGKGRTYANLMITMLLGGLWHGANWTFVIWGALHGLYLAVHKLFLGGRKVTDTPAVMTWQNFPVVIGKMLLTYFIVLMAWLCFRAPDLSVLQGYSVRMFAFEGPLDWGVICFVGLLYGLLLLIDYPTYQREDEFFLMRYPRVWRVTYGIIATGVILFFALQQPEARPFIYFQF